MKSNLGESVMKFNKKIGILLTAVIVVFLAMPSYICLAQDTTVEVNSGNMITLDPGQSRTNISISINDIPDLGPDNGVCGFGFNLSWSDSVITVDSLDEGSLPSGWFFDASLGASSASVGAIGTNPITGSATVATLDITAANNPGATTTINISSIDLIDKDGITITASGVDADVEITTPPLQYTLTINTAGTGSGSTSPTIGSYLYDEGTPVNISADPDEGSEFDSWTGDVADPGSASTTVTMDADKTVTANFTQLPQYTLTINENGNGSTIGAGTHYEGEEVTIGAYPASGWKFDFWSGHIDTIQDVNAATTKITMNSDYTITANFSEAEIFTLTMAVNGSGSTTPEAGEHIYTEGTVVDITATTDEGWEFASWSGDVADPNSTSTTITMNADKTVTANFSQIGVTNYSLTIAVNGSGSTSPAAGNYIYAEGTVVDISANPDEGWQFDGWSGDVADPNSNNTTVTMNADKTVTANFSLIPITNYTLTILVNGSGNTTPAVGVSIHEEGTVVDISATAADGWLFDGWSGDVADPDSASTTVTMDADKTVTAIFVEEAAIVYTLTMAVNGSGSTNPAVGGHDYEEGEVVSITATAADGWLFDGWSGDMADPDSASTTVTMDADKTVTASFSKEEDITPPVIPVVLAANITKTGADIFWITDEPSDSQVDFWASPGELTPLDTALVTEHLVRLTGLTPATTYHYKVMSKDASGNLTVSDEYTFVTAGTAATFIISDWDTSIKELDTGKEATISFRVTNSGDIAGSYQASLSINGDVVETREITLDTGAGQEVTFTTTQSVVGTYRMTANEFTLSFEVETGGEINWWPIIIGIIIGLVLLTFFIIIFIKRDEFRERLASRNLLGGRAKQIAGKLAKDEAKMEALAEETERFSMGGTGIEAREVEEAEKEVEEAGMKYYGLTITALAMLKLREALQSKTADPEVGLRVTISTSKPSQLKMIMDNEREGDQVVESDGVKILFLSTDLGAMLEGMIIDYHITPQGGGFSVSKLSLDE